MNRDDILNSYFEWLCNIVCEKRFAKDISYKKLLTRLHQIPFRYHIEKDANRAADGEALRWRFALSTGNENNPDFMSALDVGRSSVLEMMVALAIRCEEAIMENPKIGDRTRQWFWKMVTNLGLGSCNDNNYDRNMVDDIIERFMDRKYDFDGKGGLFRVRNTKYDLRDVEIWIQLLWHLDGFV